MARHARDSEQPGSAALRSCLALRMPGAAARNDQAQRVSCSIFGPCVKKFVTGKRSRRRGVTSIKIRGGGYGAGRLNCGTPRRQARCQDETP